MREGGGDEGGGQPHYFFQHTLTEVPLEITRDLPVKRYLQTRISFLSLLNP